MKKLLKGFGLYTLIISGFIIGIALPKPIGYLATSPVGTLLLVLIFRALDSDPLLKEQ